jgi:hypothetical protein
MSLPETDTMPESTDSLLMRIEGITDLLGRIRALVEDYLFLLPADDKPEDTGTDLGAARHSLLGLHADIVGLQQCPSPGKAISRWTEHHELRLTPVQVISRYSELFDYCADLQFGFEQFKLVSEYVYITTNFVGLKEWVEVKKAELTQICAMGHQDE